MCLYPKFIRNPKYLPNAKNGGNIPPVTDPRLLWVPIGCKNCIECTKRKARDWQVRLLEEIKHHWTNAYFVTLTFTEESLINLAKETTLTGYQLDNYTATLATRRFLERWRKDHKKSLRHWFITELGHQGTERLHIHGLIWFEDRNDIIKLPLYWKYGITWQGEPQREKNNIIGYKNYVDESTIAYISKYITKRDQDHQYYTPVILTSPGIGRNYENTPQAQRNAYRAKSTREVYKTSTGHDISLPIYYRNKLYNDHEREQLWLQKLDKNERWILGQRIDITENFKLYFILLNQAREKNRELKYGTDKVDWNQKEYENHIRALRQLTRQNAHNVGPSVGPTTQAEDNATTWAQEPTRPKRPVGPGSTTNEGAYAPPEKRPPVASNAIHANYKRRYTYENQPINNM